MDDIRNLLNEWPYDAARCVRKIVGSDGRERLQARTPMGIEQYELDGRPDGLRPHGCESALAYAEEQIDRRAAETGAPHGFELDEELAAELQHEGLIYYYRYLVCFQIGEYELVARDTARNLRMFDVLQAHCPDEGTVHSSTQYRPYLLRMNAAARSLLAVGRTEYGTAKRIIREALETIRELEPVPTDTFEYEKERSLAILRGMLRAIPKDKPLTAEDLLRRELHEAVAAENYARAAQIRDRLRGLAAGRGRRAGQA